MIKLFLDDQRPAYDLTWNLVTSAEEFEKYVIDLFEQKGVVPDIVSFDHDLAPEHYNSLMHDPAKYETLYPTFKHKTGRDCVRFLFQFCVDHDLDFPKTILHTQNPSGRFFMHLEVTNFHMFYKEEEVTPEIKPYGSSAL